MPYLQSRLPVSAALLLLATISGCHGGSFDYGGADLHNLPTQDDNSPDGGQTTPRETLHVQGRRLLDTCGNPLVIRGVEQGMAAPFITGVDASLESTLAQIALTGANAVRLLFDITPGEALNFADPANIDRIIAAAVSHRLVVYLTGGDNDWQPDADGNFRSSYRAWLGQPGIRAVVERYKKWMIVDVLAENDAPTRLQWRDNAIADIRAFRAMGYTVPLVAIGPTGGRDLPAILQYGAAIEEADPLHNTIIGWQAYWGSSGWYQFVYQNQMGLAVPTSIADGIAVASAQTFPIQVGLDYHSDPNEICEFESGMRIAGANGVGWLWWTYYHPLEWPVWQNELSVDGQISNLVEPYARTVISDGPYGLNASVKACGQ